MGAPLRRFHHSRTATRTATHQNGPSFTVSVAVSTPVIGDHNTNIYIYMTIFETFWNMLVYHQPHNLMILNFLTIYHVLCGELRFTLSFTTSTVRSGSPQRLRWTPHSWALPHLALDDQAGLEPAWNPWWSHVVNWGLSPQNPPKKIVFQCIS